MNDLYGSQEGKCTEAKAVDLYIFRPMDDTDETLHWGERLRREIERQGLTKTEVAHRAGINTNTIGSYVNSRRNKPRGDEIERLARVLGVRLEWLRDGTLPRGGRNESKGAHDAPIFPDPFTLPKDIPVLGGAAGTLDGAIQMVADPTYAIDYWRRLPGLEKRRDIYGVYVAGEAMENRLSPGDPLFVDPHRPLRVDDLVVVHVDVDGEDLAFVKLYKGSRGKEQLFWQLNPEGQWTPPGRVLRVHRVCPWIEIVSA